MPLYNNEYLRTIKTGPLIGGVSSQTASLRHSNQVQVATNVYFDPALGACDRAGTEYVKKFSTTPSDNSRIHEIDRDNDERYIVVYGAAGLEVVDVSDGSSATLNISSAASTYLSSGSPTADDYRLFTEGDTTFISNMKVLAATTTTPNYTVTASWTTYNEMVSQTPADSTYHRAIAGSGDNAAGYYLYDVDSKTFAKIVFAEVTGSELATQYGTYDNSADSPHTFRITFQRQSLSSTGATFTNGTKTLTKTGAFASYDHSVGDRIEITSGTGVTTGWYEVVSRTDDDNIVLGVDIGGTNPSDVAFDGIALIVDTEVTNSGAAQSSMFEVAQTFQEAMQAAGASDALCTWTSTGYQAGYFSITSPFRGSGARIRNVEPTGSGTDMSQSGYPMNFSAATATDGTGSVTTAQQTLDLEDRWTQQNAPNQPDSGLDDTTLPVSMVRSSISPLEFDIDLTAWSAREVGTADSNPSPQLFLDGTHAISNVIVWRGRLCLFGDQFFAMSRPDDIYSFYSTDVTQVLDGDPISDRITSGGSAVVEHVVPHNRKLFITTKSPQQYEIHAADTLTPTSIKSDVATRHVARNSKPYVQGERLYFATGNGNNASQLREYLFDESTVASDANDISEHVVGYPPSHVRKLTGHADSGSIFMLFNGTVTGDAVSSITTCKLMYENGRRVQNAWSRYVFDSGYDIKDIAMLGGYLYLLIKDGSDWFLEKMAMRNGYKDADYAFTIKLDRQVELTGSYSDPTTTWTLPFSDNSINYAVLSDAHTGSEGKVVEVSTSGTSATATGDYSADAAILGRSFSYSIELSRTYWRDQNGHADYEVNVTDYDAFVEYKGTGDLTITSSDSGTTAADVVTTVTAPSGTLIAGRTDCYTPGDSFNHSVTISKSTPRPACVTAVQQKVAHNTGGIY